MSFLFKELRSVKFKDLLSDIKSVKGEKSSFSVLFDVIKSIKKYGCSVKEYFLYKFYLLSDIEKGTFVTKSINEDIIKKYNNVEDSSVFNDNVVFYQVFKSYVKRVFIDLRLVSFKEFKEFIIDKDKIVSKCINSDSYEVINIDRDKLKNEYNVLKIYNSIMKNEEFLVSNYIEFSDSYKIVSFLGEDGKVNVLCSDKFVSDELKSYLSDISNVLKSVRYVEWNIGVSKDGFVLNGGKIVPSLYENIQSSGKNQGCLIEYSKYIDIKGE